MKRRNSFSWKRVLSSPFALIAVLVVFAVMARAAWTMISRSRESAARLAEAEAQYAKLEQNQQALSGEVAELSAPGGVAADLREKYHAVSPGESVAVIVDDPSTGDPDDSLSASAADAAPPAPAESWWQRFLGWFGL